MTEATANKIVEGVGFVMPNDIAIWRPVFIILSDGCHIFPSINYNPLIMRVEKRSTDRFNNKENFKIEPKG